MAQVGQASLERRAAFWTPYGLLRGRVSEPAVLRRDRVSANDRPENSPQDPEKTESAPGLATTAEASGGVDTAREQVNAFAPPEPAPGAWRARRAAERSPGKPAARP